MDDNDNPRVQAHAGAALVNFSEECPKNILAQYLDTIIAKLEQVLTAKFKEVSILISIYRACNFSDFKQNSLFSCPFTCLSQLSRIMCLPMVT